MLRMEEPSAVMKRAFSGFEKSLQQGEGAISEFDKGLFMLSSGLSLFIVLYITF